MGTNAFTSKIDGGRGRQQVWWKFQLMGTDQEIRQVRRNVKHFPRWHPKRRRDYLLDIR